jgi:hypothetical protein
MLRNDWLGGKWLEAWEIGINLPYGRFPQYIKRVTCKMEKKTEKP